MKQPKRPTHKIFSLAVMGYENICANTLGNTFLLNLFQDELS